MNTTSQKRLIEFVEDLSKITQKNNNPSDNQKVGLQEIQTGLSNINETLTKIIHWPSGRTADVFTVVHVLLWLRSLLTECECGIGEAVERFNNQVNAKEIKQYKWHTQCQNYLNGKNGLIDAEDKNLRDFFIDPICQPSTADDLDPEKAAPEQLESWRDLRVYDIDSLHTALIAYFPETKTIASTGEPTGEQDLKAMEEKIAQLETKVEQMVTSNQKILDSLPNKIGEEVKKNLGQLSPQVIQDLTQKVEQIQQLDPSALRLLSYLFLNHPYRQNPQQLFLQGVYQDVNAWDLLKLLDQRDPLYKNNWEMIEEMFGEKDEQLKPKTQRFQEFLQKFNEFQKHQSPAAG